MTQQYYEAAALILSEIHDLTFTREKMQGDIMIFLGSSLGSFLVWTLAEEDVLFNFGPFITKLKLTWNNNQNELEIRSLIAQVSDHSTELRQIH